MGWLTKYSSCRWILAYILCFLRLCQVSVRQNIGMALVCMSCQPAHCNVTNSNGMLASKDVIQTYSNKSLQLRHPLEEGISITGLNPQGTTGINDSMLPHSCTDKEGYEFQWDAAFEGHVLSSYYYGYLSTLFVSSYLQPLFGSKNIIGLSVFVGVVANALIPELTRINKYFLVGLRIIAGATNGMIDPPVQSLWASWAPRSERASLTAVEHTGISLGGVLTFFISGLLCQVPVNNGWPFVFYFYSGTNIVWLVVYWILVNETPASHPRISPEELSYIEESTDNEGTSKRKLNPPWMSMLRSTAVWAIILASTCFMWVYSWILAYLPMYMHDILMFNISENTIFSPLPFIGKFVSGLAFGYMADRLLLTKMTVSCNRKMFQIIGCLGCAVCTMVVGYLDYKSRNVALLMLVLAVVFQNMTSVAFRINVLDIAPRFAAFVFCIANSVAVCVCMTAPHITAHVVNDGTHDQWQVMFYIVSALSVFGGVAFVLLGKADVQEWAKIDEKYTVGLTVDVEQPTSENGTLVSLDSIQKSHLINSQVQQTKAHSTIC